MTTAQTIRRPTIPAEWYQPSILGTVGFILYVLALYAVPASLSYLVATSVDPLILKIVLIIPLTIIAGYGTQMLGVLLAMKVFICHYTLTNW
jgi:beta-carotene hydroxylase